MGFEPCAGMAELVDAPDSKSGVLGRGGSIPSARTTTFSMGLKPERRPMRSILPVATLLAFVWVGASAPARAAECVKMDFFDQNGAVIPTSDDVIGIMIGTQIILGGQGPVAVSKKPSGPAPCPAKLVETVQELFNMSCPTEERRQKAARDNKVDIAIINASCGNMTKALSPAQ